MGNDKNDTTSAVRMRIDAPNLYDAFYIFEYNVNMGNTSNAIINKKYPTDVNDERSIASIKDYCFPRKSATWSISEPVTFFTFILVDGEGYHTYGHCRFSPSKDTCMCIVSGSPDAIFYKKVLEYLAIAQPNESDLILQYLYHTSMPKGQDKITFPDIMFAADIRDYRKYFHSFNNMELLMFSNILQFSPDLLIALYSSLIQERRIVIVSSRFDALTNCVFGAIKLMAPFFWQSLVSPVLPSHMTDQLMAPMPFIYGFQKEVFDGLKKISEFGELTVLDIDTQTFQADIDYRLPLPIHKFLLKQLKPKDSNGLMTNPDLIVNTFMKANILLFGRYRSGLCKADSSEKGSIRWDTTKFIEAQPPELRSFIEEIVTDNHVQYFERFIAEKVAELNAGIGSNEEFDRLLRNVDEYYQEALDVSRNFKDSFQGVVSGVKNKTNDALSSFKDSVQQTLKKKSKIKLRKPKDLPFTPYSFAPPQPSVEHRVSEIPSREDERIPSPDHLIHFNDDEGASNSILSTSRSTSSTSQNAFYFEIAPLSSTANSTNPFTSLAYEPLSSTNPFSTDVIIPENQLAPTRSNWEKFD